MSDLGSAEGALRGSVFVCVREGQIDVKMKRSRLAEGQRGSPLALWDFFFFLSD